MKNLKKNIHITQIIRHIIQIAAFIFFPGLFISVFHAIPNLITAAAANTFSMASNGSDVFLVLAVFPITILWGRFFCGYLCSFGAIQDLIHFISHLIFPKKKRIRKKYDHILKFGKYIILAVCCIFIWSGIWKMSADFSPWTIFGFIATFDIVHISEYIMTVGMFLFLIILIASFFEERFFCRYLCPLGGIFSLVSIGRLFKIKRKPDECINCSLCDKTCSMGINISKNKVVNSGECIDCMKCTEVCPKDCLTDNASAAINGTVASAAILGLFMAGNIAEKNIFTADSSSSISFTASDSSSDSSDSSNSSDSSDSANIVWGDDSSDGNSTSDQADSAASTESTSSSESAASTESAETDSTFKDGTYSGSGTGFRGAVDVNVTVSGGKITDIEIVSDSDNAEFFDRAKAGVISEIIDSQSVDVSTVSGATYSSNGIIGAVADALNLDYTPVTPSGHGH